MMDEIDRSIVNALQGGFPIAEHPFAEAAAPLGLTEAGLIARVGALVVSGVLSRFGPLYNAERMGGAVTLAALKAPEDRFEEVAAIVNAFPEVAHNYAREDTLNMWFVVSSADAERRVAVLGEIAAATGLEVFDMPKLDEYFLELRLQA